MISTPTETIAMGEYHSTGAHIELNNGILDVTIPFINLIILVLTLNTNFCNNLL